MLNIPSHSEGLCALKTTGEDGRFVLLCADGGYAKKSWEQMVLSGVAGDRAAQKKSLSRIRAQSQDQKCVACIANHDPDVEQGTITL